MRKATCAPTTNAERAKLSCHLNPSAGGPRSELDRGGRPVEPGTEGGEHDEVTLLDPPALNPLPHGERDSGRAGGPVFVAVDVHPLLSHAKPLPNRFDDPKIGLMRDH